MEVIAAGGSYNPTFEDHQVWRGGRGCGCRVVVPLSLPRRHGEGGGQGRLSPLFWG